MRSQHGLRSILACWVYFSFMPVFAYDVMENFEGGTLQGTVTLQGPPPEPKAYNLVTYPDPEYCGRISNGKGWRLLQDFIVNDDGRLQDVVVLLEGVQSGKPFSLSIPLVEARDCRFLPFTTVVRSGHGVEVVNMDPVMHDVQAYETSRVRGTRVLFNSPLPFNHWHKRGDVHATHHHPQTKSIVRQFTLNKKRKTFVMQCGFHAFMESWAIAVDNPYYSLTDAKGQFVIDTIPPGTYNLRAWHPSIKKAIRKRVIIQPGDNLTLSFHLPSPVGRVTNFTVMTHPRFGMGALGRPLTIEPSVERQ